MSAITNERPHPDATTTATTLTTMTTTTKAAAVVAAATTTATISHNQLTVEEEWTQPLPPVAFCPRTPERVLTRTLDGELQMLRCSYLAPGEEAMISPQWSLSPLPERSCWDAPYRLRLPGATPLQGAIDLTTEEASQTSLQAHGILCWGVITIVLAFFFGRSRRASVLWIGKIYNVPQQKWTPYTNGGLAVHFVFKARF